MFEARFDRLALKPQAQFSTVSGLAGSLPADNEDMPRPPFTARKGGRSGPDSSSTPDR